MGRFLAPNVSGHEILLTSARHYAALSQCSESLLVAIDAVHERTPLDALALHIRTSLSSLDSILGLVSSDEILNNIFSTFCVGK